MASSTITKTLTTSTLRPLKRLFSSTPTITRPPPIPLTRLARPTLLISKSARSLAPFSPFSPTRFDTIRCRVNRSAPYSPLNNNSGGSNFSDRPPTEIAPLFPGCDYEHWLIVMDKPGGDNATKQQMIDCYVQTLSNVVGRVDGLAVMTSYGLAVMAYYWKNLWDFQITPSLFVMVHLL